MFNRKKYFISILLVGVAILLLSQSIAFANPQRDEIIPSPDPELSNYNPNPTIQSPTLQVTSYPSSTLDMHEMDYLADPTPPEVNDPHRISLTLDAGERHDFDLTVTTGDKPIGKGDIMFVFDRTGSMSAVISQAKLSSVQIMNDVQAQLPNTWFGVGSFMDYPGYFEYPGYANTYGASTSGDIPWELNISPTDNITDVSDKINGLSLGFGEDWPEDYTRVLYELNQIEQIGWRSNSKKIVVLFGDAPTHDLDFAGYNFGGDPGEDKIAQTSDDLDFETEVQSVANNEISIIAVDSGYTPESEATLKGMSIGYETVSGTNGAYFLLTDSSQIPGATVDLITTETDQINRLYLKVTEGYENWVQITPSEFANVGPNTTLIFELSIKVPKGTASDYYPFLIQTIGDGTILDGTYVEITVPTSSPINDLGFRSNPNGFRFENESSTQTWEMFDQFFGTKQVEYDNGNRIHAAEEFFNDEYIGAGDPASCDGFSVLSLLNYKNSSQPNAGNFAMPHYSQLYNQNKNNEITEAIAFSQAIQLGLEIKYHTFLTCELLDNSPKAFYAYLKSQIQNNSPAILHIAADKDYFFGPASIKALSEGDGHAIVPYRFEEPSSDKAYIYVYDSNLPGNDKHRVEFDLTNDKWNYRWPVPLWPDVTIEGDNSRCLLSVTPLEMYRHQGVAWWDLPETSMQKTSLMPEIPIQLFSTHGPIRLLFTDDEGRRLGWDGLTFSDEIPGAGYSTIAHGNGNSKSGFFFIPGDLTYFLEAQGESEGYAEISVWSNGYMVKFSDIEVETDLKFTLEIEKDGSGIAITGATTATNGSMKINQLLPTEDRTVNIGNLSVNPGDDVLLQFLVSDQNGSPDVIKLSTTSPEDQTYALSLQRAGGDGYQVFGHLNLILDSNSNAIVELENWSNLEELSVSIDFDKDGEVDEIRNILDETSIDSIFIEANPSVIHTGGEEVKIIVSVKDQFGAYVEDGTIVNLNTDLGTLSINQGSTSGGLIELTMTSGSMSGIAIITAVSGDIEESVEVEILDYLVFLPITRH